MSMTSMPQSGADEVLRYMNITYPASEVSHARQELNQAIKKIIDDAHNRGDSGTITLEIVNALLSISSHMDKQEIRAEDLNERMKQVQAQLATMKEVDAKPEWRKRITDTKSAHHLKVFSGAAKE